MLKEVYPLFAYYCRDRGVNGGQFKVVLVDGREDHASLRSFLCSYDGRKLVVEDERSWVVAVAERDQSSLNGLASLSDSLDLFGGIPVGQSPVTVREVLETFREALEGCSSRKTVVFSSIHLKELIQKVCGSSDFYFGPLEEFVRDGMEALKDSCFLFGEAPEIKAISYAFDFDQERFVEREVLLARAGGNLGRFVTPTPVTGSFRVLFNGVVLEVDGQREEVGVPVEGLPMEEWRVYLFLKGSELSVFLRNERSGDEVTVKSFRV